MRENRETLRSDTFTRGGTRADPEDKQTYNTYPGQLVLLLDGVRNLGRDVVGVHGTLEEVQVDEVLNHDQVLRHDPCHDAEAFLEIVAEKSDK